MAEKSQTNRPTSAARPISQRSAVTNGRRLFVEGDGRSPWARRWRDLFELHAADLGGADVLTEAQAALCRRAATLSIELERMEGALSASSAADMDLYGRLAGHQRRILESIGIERRQRAITPSVSEYLAAVAKEAESRGVEAEIIAATNN